MSGVLGAVAGASGAVVDYIAHTVDDTQASPTEASAGFTFNTDGTLTFTGNGSDSDTVWVIPDYAGIGDNYEVRVDVTGDAPTTGSTGVWLALTSNRLWNWLSGAGPASKSATAQVRVRRASDAVELEDQDFTVSVQSVL